MKKFLLILMTCAVAMGLYAQQPCPGIPTVTDVEGNVYNTVKIGNQCWTKENLRTTHFADGTPILSGDLYSAISDTISYYYESPDSVIPLVERGLLYNWLAANNVCPTGWHLPTNAEWNTMEATQTTYSLTGTGWRGDHAGRLAGGTDWRYTTSTPDSTPGFSNYTAYNASGFTAIPAGYRYNSYMESKWAAYFWTATSGGGTLAWHRKLYYNKIGVYHSTQNTAFGLSVRCLRDPGPVINTGSLYGITTTSATCGGEVLDDDGYSVTARGVCWSTSHNPTVADAHTSNGTDVGAFSSSITGLTPGTTYYVRAYATNSQGTAYGEEVVFATQNPPCPGVPTVTDHEGNVYNTIKIGNQCWTKENLRTTTSPSTGTYLIPSASTEYTYTGKQARWNNNDSATYASMNFGLLYNWNAAVDTFNTAYGETSVNADSSNALPVTFNGRRRGICPVGWHLPSDNEWQQLINYVGSVPGYQCGGSSSSIAKALASTTEWSSNSDVCNVGNQQGSNNATGFSAIPAGLCIGTSFYLKDFLATFWSSSYYPSCHAYFYMLDFNSSSMYRGRIWDYVYGLSVRCLRDPIPAVSTGSVLGVTTTTATCGGEVVNAGGSSVTARGVCWSTSHNPTIADAHTSNGTGLGAFTSNITGLTPGTYYYVRAYATNSDGTAYGEEKSFITSNPPCPGVPTVRDHDGNVYNTIKIGNQCWTKENLRTTHYADGTDVPAGESVTSNSEPYYYDNINDSLPLEKKGYFYNWPAVMHGSASSNANPSGVQGICPTGWHVPSDAEWTQLTDYVSSQSMYRCNGYNTNIAKALASETWWSDSDEGNYCAVGHNQTTNNLTGFSAVPVGYRDDSSFGYDEGIAAFFWSSTQDGSDNAWARNLFCINATVYRESDNKYDALSVRCLRDLAPAITTGSVLGVTTTTATCGGEVVDDGGLNVTARGVCWSTSHNPTIADAHTSNGTGLGQFTGNITGLTPGTYYYVRAYATNSAGTAYGEEVSFFTECLPEDQCELTFVLTDSYGDGWNGNAIQVTDAETGVVLATMANEDLHGLGNYTETTQSFPLALCNGRTIIFEWVNGEWSQETSYTVYDGQGEVIFSGSGGFTDPISYTVNCASPCPTISLPYTEDFDSYTTSTTAATGEEPTCWNLVQSDVQTMTDANRPQLYYKSSYAHSGSYSLLLNYRGVYAMPELSEEIPLNQVKLEMYLRQPKAYYQLQVGVWEDNGTFVPVATFNNSGTGVTHVECNFSNYTGNGNRIAFRNVLASGYSYNYSYNYIDDITLTNNCDPITLPYAENFDSYTTSTTAETGEQPDCWEVVSEDVALTASTKPQLYHSTTYATSGSYTLRMKNRCVYAMPELDENVDVSGLTMTFKLRQPKAVYRLQVGVVDSQGTFKLVKTVNNASTSTEDVTIDFANYTGSGHRIAFRNTLVSGSTLDYSINYIDDITLDYTPAPCGISELPYAENFDSYTTSTTAETGEQPRCWEVVSEDVALTASTKPQLYHSTTYATSGSYTLRMKNRCVYAMPELDENVDVSGLTMTFRLRQPKAVYRLQVGVVDGQGTFKLVKTVNNASTGTEDVTVDFANYTGHGHRIAFRNTLVSGSTLDYSINYIDDITLDYTPASCGISELPYSENFDNYTQSTTTETGVQPDCWEVTQEDVTLTNATKPQLYRGYASSGAYSLRLKNRCVYAMPELHTNEHVIDLTMTFKLRQPKSIYRLQVGVVDGQGNFQSVKTINNASTGMEDITVNFSNYNGNGRRIAFRNTLVSGSTLDYSINYIDDINLTWVTNNKSAEISDTKSEDTGVMGTDRNLEDITIYPNPTTGMLHIDVVEVQKVVCYNAMGQIVGEYDNVHDLDLSSLAAGVYTLRITVPQGSTMRKVVKR